LHKFKWSGFILKLLPYFPNAGYEKAQNYTKGGFFYEIVFHNKVFMIMNERKINEKEFRNCRFFIIRKQVNDLKFLLFSSRPSKEKVAVKWSFLVMNFDGFLRAFLTRRTRQTKFSGPSSNFSIHRLFSLKLLENYPAFFQILESTIRFLTIVIKMIKSNLFMSFQTTCRHNLSAKKNVKNFEGKSTKKTQ
jgi:hypothetical protein